MTKRLQIGISLMKSGSIVVANIENAVAQNDCGRVIHVGSTLRLTEEKSLKQNRVQPKFDPFYTLLSSFFFYLSPFNAQLFRGDNTPVEVLIQYISSSL